MKKAMAFLILAALAYGILVGVISITGYLLLYCLGGLVFLVLFIWFGLAPRNIFFTFVKEGTAKIVVRGDKFQKVLIQWEGYALDEDWNVVERAARGRFFGGMRLYGFWPFDQIYTYNFQWTGVAENGEIQAHPKKRIDYVLLKDDVYWAKIEKAEDNELLPLDVEVLLTQRVVNPRKALFAIQNWLETIINRTKPAVRDSITLSTYRKLIAEEEAIGEGVYNRLEKRDILKGEFLDRYGVEIRRIEIKSINPEKKFREATLKKWLGEREAEARVAATVGTLIEMMVAETGMSREEVQVALKVEPEEFIKKHEKVWERNWDILHRRMAIDGQSFIDIRVDGAGEIEGTLLNLLAAWQRMPKGGATNSKKEGAKDNLEKDKKEKSNLTLEDATKSFLENKKSKKGRGGSEEGDEEEEE